MYERFTDRARKVMQLANQEAQRLNHAFLGTEHVLLGLVKEGDGVAANVLRNLDVDLRKVRQETETLLPPGAAEVSMGKLPLTKRTEALVEHATLAARSLGHNYIGTEHLLLGLVPAGGIAAQVLANLGVEPAAVREEVLTIIGGVRTMTEPKPDGPFQPGAIVRLKSGGPRMTVAGVPTKGLDYRALGYTVCQWFDGCSLEEGYFRFDVLEPAEPEPERKEPLL